MRTRSGAVIFAVTLAALPAGAILAAVAYLVTLSGDFATVGATAVPSTATALFMLLATFRASVNAAKAAALAPTHG